MKPINPANIVRAIAPAVRWVIHLGVLDLKEITVDMDMDAEVTAIVDFISQKWSPIPDLEKLITKVRDQALFDGRGWFNESEFTLRLMDLSDQRVKMLEEIIDDPEQKSQVFLYDNVRSAIDQMRTSAKVMREAGLTLDVDVQDKYFEQYTKPLAKEIHNKFPGFSRSKPLGWAESAKNYTDYAGQEEYRAEADRDLFQGVDSKGRSWHLVEKLALPYLLYDDKCQGRSPTYMMVSSVYSHFLGIREFINTKEMITAVEKLLPFHEPRISFGLVVSTDTGNSLVDILVGRLKPFPTKKESDQSLLQQREFSALSEEAQAERKRINSVRVKEMIENMFRHDPVADAARQEQEMAEVLEMKRLMRDKIKSPNPSATTGRRQAPEAGMEI